MSRARVAMSDSKSVMMRRLSLSGEHGERIYKLLLDEASLGRDRVSLHRSNLPDHLRENNYFQAPFRWDELSESAKYREVLNIVNSASRYTQPYYTMGQYYEGHNLENWVARWFLWHAFRYRDNRPRTDTGNARRGYGGGLPGYGAYYDPVHDGYRH